MGNSSARGRRKLSLRGQRDLRPIGLLDGEQPSEIERVERLLGDEVERDVEIEPSGP